MARKKVASRKKPKPVKIRMREEEPFDGFLVPTGAVLPFYGYGINLRPVGYYYCDGSIISRTKDFELYHLLTSANPALKIDTEQCYLPDLRGEFLRGYDDNRDVDRGRKFGTPQVDEIKSHSHMIWRTTKGPTGNSTYVNWNYMGPDPDKGQTPGLTPFGGNETRPRNIAITFIIKR